MKKSNKLKLEKEIFLACCTALTLNASAADVNVINYPNNEVVKDSSLMGLYNTAGIATELGIGEVKTLNRKQRRDKRK